ncbi:hypothetical protein MQE36_01450 [Zhouia spongiae]|uniref:Outer membrane protein beta-barrel domain-containing protein n=1 Tax=Zhouia spongiae TaxID=2202721 RepID=A0ABY3YMH3_9FLAO|nr:hypothetical protein [Zhouia spongiae]UNY99029.1 hypothetical protein MQE36_01450 [Zhouia spongiae]
MNQIKITLALFLLGFSFCVNAQESGEYIEFNDRKNTVHGVYMGLATYYGKMHKKDTYAAGFKVAYVANQQFEVGLEAVGLYSDINRLGISDNDNDLVGAYGGIHLEPILFSKSILNLSFPLLIGGGAIGILEGDIDDYVVEDDSWEAVFVLEPGINLLFNINRYVQLEAGVKHRFSSRLSFDDFPLSRIDGFSAGIGVKIGVFNMGRNRYKKSGL